MSIPSIVPQISFPITQDKIAEARAALDAARTHASRHIDLIASLLEALRKACAHPGVGTRRICPGCGQTWRREDRDLCR